MNEPVALSEPVVSEPAGFGLLSGWIWRTGLRRKVP